MCAEDGDAMTKKKCPSCFVLHTPDRCPLVAVKPEDKKPCPSCFVLHTPDKCPTKVKAEITDWDAGSRETVPVTVTFGEAPPFDVRMTDEQIGKLLARPEVQAALAVRKQPQRLFTLRRPRDVAFNFKYSGNKGDVIEVSMPFTHAHRGMKIFAADSLDKPFKDPPGWRWNDDTGQEIRHSDDEWKVFRAARRAYEERPSATSMSVTVDGVLVYEKLPTTHWNDQRTSLHDQCTFDIKHEMKFIVEFAEDCDWSAAVLTRPWL